MQLKCINPQCGQIYEQADDGPAPLFCPFCGQRYETNPESTSPEPGLPEAVQDSGETAAELQPGSPVEAVQAAQDAPPEASLIKGPPAPERDDIPLLRVEAAPPDLLSDSQVPVTTESTTIGIVAAADPQPVMTTDEPVLQESEETVQISGEMQSIDQIGGEDDMSLEGESAAANPLFDDPDSLFQMLNRQLSEQTEHKSEEAVEERTDIEEDDSPKVFIKREEEEEQPESFLHTDVHLQDKVAQWASGESILSKLSTSAWVKECFGYPLRELGRILFAGAVILWILLAGAMYLKFQVAVGFLVFFSIVYCTACGVAAVGLGSTGSRSGFPKSPEVDSEAWTSFWLTFKRSCCFIVFLALVSVLSVKFARGVLALVPFLLCIGILLISFRTKWLQVFDPRKHLMLFMRAPSPMARSVFFGSIFVFLLPLITGMLLRQAMTEKVISDWLDNKGPIALFAIYYSMAGPLSWFLACATGFGLGLTWQQHQERFMADLPPHALESAVAMVVLIVAVLLSVML